MEKIRFYITCHKPCATVENEVVRPVSQQALAAQLARGDAQDAFVAAHADSFCELVTQYWAWKYDDAEVVGFGHYRRYFEFNDSVKSNAYCMVKRDYLDGAAVRELGLSDEARIRAEAEKYDVITPVPFNYYVKSVYWQYKSSGTLHIEDLDTVLEIIREEFPQYLKAAKKYLLGHYMYACNMFVMKRELFLEYSEWLFSILRKFYERRDMVALGYSNEAMRTPGHLGERLFGVFCAYLSERGGIRFGRRRTVQFENTEPEEEYYPAFGGKGAAVFMPVRAERVCLAAATLSSLAGAAGENCDVIALCDGVKAEDKDKLRAVTAGKSKLSLRFFDAARLLSGQGVASLKGDARTAYMQLSLADAFPHYDRALWLDDDCIVLADISPLYAADLGGALCGLILRYPLHQALSIGGGLGWYSLAGVSISSLADVSTGGVAFLSNLMREIASFILIPWVAHHANAYTCIAIAGATSEDTTLPMILRYSDEQTAVFSVLNGIICSAFVPVLLSLCY